MRRGAKLLTPAEVLIVATHGTDRNLQSLVEPNGD